jgi:predicted glycosyltransferase
MEIDLMGRFAGKGRLKKSLVGVWRSLLMAKWSLGKRIDLAVGFGSRPLALACALRRIPNASIFDYEHVSIRALNWFCDWIFVPSEVSIDGLAARGANPKKIIHFVGLKEAVYARGYEPDAGLIERLGYDTSKTIVVIRPPATKAHYHEGTGEVICERTLERIARDPSTLAILMARDDDPTFERFFAHPNIVPLSQPVNGLDLIAGADLVISGGGTMVREAAVLGVPSYSTFTGKLGAVDARLSEQGRLMLVRDPEDAEKIVLAKRDRTPPETSASPDLLDFFVAEHLRLADEGRPKPNPSPN